LRDPIWKKTHHKKRAGGIAQGVGPEFKPQYQKKKKKKSPCLSPAPIASFPHPSPIPLALECKASTRVQVKGLQEMHFSPGFPIATSSENSYSWKQVE
jgi:hypothetical protein